MGSGKRRDKNRENSIEPPSRRERQDQDRGFTAKMQFVRRNDWREAAEKPLNRQFCAAGDSADAAEMAQLQRIAPVCPLRRKCRSAAAVVAIQRH